MQSVKTLKEVSQILNISPKQVREIKLKIQKECGYAPSWMVFGTGEKKKYIIESFKKHIKN